MAGSALLVLGVLISSPAQASFEDGVRAYLAQDYQTAIAEWRPLAQKGHAAAQFGLGLSYENGRGVKRDLTEAAIWYRKAAEQGLADAQFNLGNLYLNGTGVAKDPDEAVRWYRRAAEQGMPHAQVNLGYSYEVGSGVPQSAEQAVSWYRKAAEQNFAQAHFYMGAAYERGSGVPRDLAIAAAWYQRAAQQGIAQARDRLDMLREQNIQPAQLEPLPAGSEGTKQAERYPIREPEQPAPDVKEQPKAEPVRETKVVPEAANEPSKPESSETMAKAEPEHASQEPTPAPKEETVARQSEPAQPKPETNAAPAENAASASGSEAVSLEKAVRVRLASYREPGNAEKGWQILFKKHRDLLGSLKHTVVQVDLGPEKGVFHRLEAGPLPSGARAEAVCAEIKRRGDSCLAVRP